MPDWLTELFHVRKPVIAMAHVPALPGTPHYDADGGMDAVGRATHGAVAEG